MGGGRVVRGGLVTALFVLAVAVSAAPAAGVPQGPAQADSLDLRAALSLARERSPALAAAAAAVREAEGSSAVARSGRGPRFAADALYLRFEDPPAVGLAPLGFFAPVQENNYLLQLQVTQPIYTFGRVSSRWTRGRPWPRRCRGWRTGRASGTTPTCASSTSW